MRHDAGVGQDDRSLGDLFGELTRELGSLVRQEINLAKTEMSGKAAKAGKNIGFVAAGGFLAYAGLLALISALILGLIEAGLPGWASALIVGLLVVGAGGFMAMKGLNGLKEVDPVPRQTVETLKAQGG